MTAIHACDIAVIGAGPAGVAAAVAARQAGARSVLLIEASPTLGGSVTAAMHRAICGLYAHQPDSICSTLNSGVQREIVDTMARLDPLRTRPVQMGKTWVLEFPPHAWQQALLQSCAAVGVTLSLSTQVTAVSRTGNRLTALHLQGASQGWIDISSVIDCSGAGRGLSLVGQDAFQEPQLPTRSMMAGYAIRIGHITGPTDQLRLLIPHAIAKALEQGILSPLDKLTTFHPGPDPAQGVCKLAVDPHAILAGDLHTRAQTLMNHLRRTLPQLADAQIIGQSPTALPRDGLRLQGRLTLTRSDVLTGNTSNAAPAAKAWWPIERWDSPAGPTYAYAPVGKPYDIPQGALRSANVENLLAAGMNLSADPDAAASARASGICLATGAAAGNLAPFI